jgi:AraC-like DNA-binding protein
MPKPSTLRDSSTSAVSHLRGFRGDPLPFKDLFASVCSGLGCETAMLVTTLPRGSMQLAQPPKLRETVLKAYSREFHLYDRIAWEAVVRNQPVRAEECWPGGEFRSGRFFREFMEPNGLRYATAAPMAAPLLPGYPGALIAFRTAEEGAFTGDDAEQLGELATEFEGAIDRVREARRHAAGGRRRAPLRQQPQLKVFVFDGSLRMRFGAETFDTLDHSLRQNVLDVARQRLGHLNGDAAAADRVSLPDARGDLWNFRVTTHREYPALGEGPSVFFCLQPECGDWGLLRSSDFAADPELAKLVPALKFMQDHFHRRKLTLHDISKTVQLSPFHFHRRFTELLGITPKHFLLDCQIQHAKDQLVARQKELAQIAADCGFAHQSHFTSRFKQATGLTPTRWRRMADMRR